MSGEFTGAGLLGIAAYSSGEDDDMEVGKNNKIYQLVFYIIFFLSIFYSYMPEISSPLSFSMLSKICND